MFSAVQSFKSWLLITSFVSASFISIGNNKEDKNGGRPCLETTAPEPIFTL